MQKFFTQKALILFTLAFVLIAVASFVAFRETEQVCLEAKCTLKEMSPTQQGEMIWEALSRRFVSFLSV